MEKSLVMQGQAIGPAELEQVRGLLAAHPEPDRIVEVNCTHSSYPPKTLRIFIRHSGIARDEWVKWTAS
jgi:hypothetical protein